MRLVWTRSQESHDEGFQESGRPPQRDPPELPRPGREEVAVQDLGLHPGQDEEPALVDDAGKGLRC